MALDNILKCAFSYKTNCQIEGWVLMYFNNHMMNDWCVSYRSRKLDVTVINASLLLLCIWVLQKKTFFQSYHQVAIKNEIKKKKKKNLEQKLDDVFPIFHSSHKNTYTKAIYELLDIINLRIRTFPYHNKLIFDLSPHGFQQRKHRSIMFSHTGELQPALSKMQRIP